PFGLETGNLNNLVPGPNGESANNVPGTSDIAGRKDDKGKECRETYIKNSYGWIPGLDTVTQAAVESGSLYNLVDSVDNTINYLSDENRELEIHAGIGIIEGGCEYADELAYQTSFNYTQYTNPWVNAL